MRSRTLGVITFAWESVREEITELNVKGGDKMKGIPRRGTGMCKGKEVRNSLACLEHV